MKRFKNVIAFMLVASMALSAASCSIRTESEVIATESTQPTYLVGSPGANEECEFVVTDLKSFSIATDYGEVMDYILIEVSYTNLTDTVQDVSRRNVEFYLDNEEIAPCEYRSEFEDYFEEGLMFNDKKVNPGRSKRGYIVYRIYREYSIINICFDGITIMADSDEVVPLVLPSEEVIEQTAPVQTEPVVETAPPPVEVVVEPEVQIDPETGEPIVVEEVPAEEVPSE